ncbi:MAG: 50S ribosomal protein L10 [Acidobacteriota bacterium]|jgi:large subunit ribosomal protein L10
MLTRQQKQQQIDSLTAALQPSSGVFVMGYQGLTVAEVTELREKVRAASGKYVVVKNTLARIALGAVQREALQGLMEGPVALAITAGDSAQLAKVLAEFAKGHEKLQFRGALVEGQLLDAAQAQQVALLPGKEELVARLLYVLQSPMRRLVTALNWPLRSLAVTVKQIAEEKERQA